MATPDPGNPGLLARAAQVILHGSDGFPRMSLKITRVRVITVPSFRYTTDLREALRAVQRAFLDPGMLNEVNRQAEEGLLTVYMTGENALCGAPADEGGWRYPASNAVPFAWQTDMQRLMQSCAAYITRLTGQKTICALTTTYDMGAVDGQRYLRNTCVLASGEDNEAWAVDKGAASSIDGMNGSLIWDATGSRTEMRVFEVKDIIGSSGAARGEPVMLSVRICLDITNVPDPSDKMSDANIIPKPDFILCPALGAPNRANWNSDAVVLVSDTADASVQGALGIRTGATGLWAIDGFHRPSAGRGDGVVILSRALLNARSVSPAVRREAAYTRPGANTVHTFENGVRYIETPRFEVRPVPDGVGPSLSDMVGNRASAIDPDGDIVMAIEDQDPDRGEEPFEPERVELLRPGLVSFHPNVAANGAFKAPHVVLGGDGVSGLSPGARESLAATFRAQRCSVTILMPSSDAVVTTVMDLLGAVRIGTEPHDDIGALTFYRHGLGPVDSIGTVTWDRRCDGDIAAQAADVSRWLHHFDHTSHPTHPSANVALVGPPAPAQEHSTVKHPPRSQPPQPHLLGGNEGPPDLFDAIQHLAHTKVWHEATGVALGHTNDAGTVYDQKAQAFRHCAVTVTVIGLSVDEGSDNPNVKNVHTIWFVRSEFTGTPPDGLPINKYILRCSIIDPAEKSPYVATAADTHIDSDRTAGGALEALIKQEGWDVALDDFLGINDLRSCYAFGDRHGIFEGWQMRVPSTGADPDAGILQSAPDSTPKEMVTYSTNVSHTFGANVGFFGDTPTGGVSASYSISHGETVSKPTMSIDNKCSQYGIPMDAQWIFEYFDEDVSKTTQNFTTQVIFRVTDTHTDDTDRGDYKTGRQQAMQFTWYAEHVKDDGNDHVVTMWRRVTPFAVLMPPLPGTIKPLPPMPPLPSLASLVPKAGVQER